MGGGGNSFLCFAPPTEMQVGATEVAQYSSDINILMFNVLF